MSEDQFARWVRRPAAAALLLAIALLAPAPSSGQIFEGQGKLPDFIPAGYDDYQNMLDQLGIKKVRKGRDSKVKDTSDEATANPYKDTMPDLMTFKDGTKVTSAAEWARRRAEIVEDFERDIYGRIPKNVPKVTWEVTINPGSAQGDNNRLREGIIGLTNKGQPRSPEDWGALRAWGWAVSKLIDYFEANPDSGVDPTKVCITGVSRYGKAAIVATAFATRVAAGFVASSGAAGVKLHRHIFGELLENIAGRGGYHWMAGNYLKYAADEAAFGTKTAADLPVDQHQLIALCAPRLCFISYGVVPGDPNWVDARGAFMAGVLAGPAYRLVGKKDLGTTGDYLADALPPVNSLIGGELAWRQHSGGHTNVPKFPGVL